MRESFVILDAINWVKRNIEFRFSPMSFVVFAVVFISSYLFFILRERLSTVALCTITAFGFQFYKKDGPEKFLLIMAFFFCSFWLLEIPYPHFGYLFWPIDQFIGTFILFVVTRFTFKTRPSVSWNWKFSKSMCLSVIGIVFLSQIGLTLYFFNHRDIAEKWPLPQMPLWAIPFAIVLIAAINGLREEIYFRFTLQGLLTQNLSPQMSILCSSVVFGFMHFQNSFPSGGLGIFLTTLFGLLIGTQFHYFRSAPLSWLTHSITDAVMFAIILLNKK